MEDPVILPTSKQIVDRATIVTHLLSDPNDPFNRAPLKIEDVIPGRSFVEVEKRQPLTLFAPDTELLARIEEFKTEKKGQKIAESDLMDTT